MRFMVIIKASADSEAGVMPSEELLTEMTAFNQELADAGVMLAGEGLHPSSKGARVTFDGSKTTVTDGPFPETKELIAGFWILDVASLEEAIEWVRRVPNTDGVHGEIEIRQVFEAEDFGDEFTPEARAQEDRIRSQIAVGQVNPYITFDGRCEEAMTFYAEVLGATVDSLFYHRNTPAEDFVPADWLDKVMHMSIKVGDDFIMGSDAPPDRYERPAGFSVQLAVGNPTDADRIFRLLAEGGSVTMPLEKTFWATRFGMLTDRFGVPWMINCE